MGVDTPAELDESNSAIDGDARYLEMRADAGSARLFVPGSTDRVILARMP